MRSKVSFLILMAFAALATVASACSSGTSSTQAGTIAPPTTGLSTSSEPTPPSTQATQPPVDPPGTHRFVLYWMRDCPPPDANTDVSGCRIAGGESRLTTDPDVPKAALDALFMGPSDVEREYGLTTNVPGRAQHSDLVIEGDTARLALNRAFETAKTRPQTAQLVFTLTQFPQIKNVVITIDGQQNGAVGTGNLNRQNVGEFTPDVFLEAPTFNATVAPSFKISGTAMTPTGTFAFKVTNPFGVELASGTATIVADPGERGTFLGNVKAPAGSGAVYLVTSSPGGDIQTPLVVTT